MGNYQHGQFEGGKGDSPILEALERQTIDSVGEFANEVYSFQFGNSGWINNELERYLYGETDTAIFPNENGSDEFSMILHESLNRDFALVAAHIDPEIEFNINQIENPPERKRLMHLAKAHLEENTQSTFNELLADIGKNQVSARVSTRRVLFKETGVIHNNVERLEVDGIERISPLYQPLPVRIATLLRDSYDNKKIVDHRKSIEKLIFGYVDNMGIEATILTMAAADIPGDYLKASLNNRKTTMMERFKWLDLIETKAGSYLPDSNQGLDMIAGLVDSAREALLRHKPDNAYEYSPLWVTKSPEIYQEVVSIIKSKLDGVRGLSEYIRTGAGGDNREEEAALEFHYVANKRYVPRVVFQGLGELLYRNAPKKFLEPARGTMLLHKSSHRGRYTSKIVSIHQKIISIDRIPNQLIEQGIVPLESYDPNEVNKFLVARMKVTNVLYNLPKPKSSEDGSKKYRDVLPIERDSLHKIFDTD